MLRTAGRVPWAIGDVWAEESLDVGVSGQFVNAFTRAPVDLASRVALREVFAVLPVAVLLKA